MTSEPYDDLIEWVIVINRIATNEYNLRCQRCRLETEYKDSVEERQEFLSVHQDCKEKEDG